MSKLQKKLVRQMRQAIENFSMFDREDSLLVALSGGKDSLTMALLLKELNYSFEALFIDLEIFPFSSHSKEIVEKFTAEQNIKLHIVSSMEIEKISMDRVASQYQHYLCATCGSIKRRIFNRFAKENGFSVLLVGHTLDDTVRFILANSLRWDYKHLSRSWPVLAGHGPFMKRAKPMVLIEETDVIKFVKAYGIECVTLECSYAEEGSKQRMLDLVRFLENGNPFFKRHYFANFVKEFPVDLLSQYYKEKNDYKGFVTCEICGEIGSSNPCRLCKVREVIGSS